MGFQEGVEGDFMAYKNDYIRLANGAASAAITSENDYVWLFLTETFSKVAPFWVFIILMAGFECLVLFILCRKYGSKKYGLIAPILFFFTFYMMLIQMKALRQGLAVEMVVLSYILGTEKKGIWWSSGLLIAAMFVHHSTLAVIPFIILHIVVSRKSDYDKPIPFRKGLKTTLFPVAMLVLYLIVYSLKATMLGDWLNQLALIGESQSIQLSGYLVKEQDHLFEISWLIVMYNAVMVFFCSWFMQRTTRRYRVLAIASIIGCYGDMLLFGAGSLPRIMMFYYIFNLLVYPQLAELIANKFGKIPAFVFIAFLVGYAVKSSLPIIQSVDAVMAYGTYRFVFM